MGQIEILGASGMIVSAIAKELNANSHTLRALGRSISNQGLLDLYIPDAIEPSIFSGCDTLIHAAGVIDVSFKTSNRTPTKNMAVRILTLQPCTTYRIFSEHMIHTLNDRKAG